MLHVEYGRLLNNIWYNITPHDHRSALDPYTSLFSTSGAIYNGDPNEVCMRSSGYFNLLENPKSASFNLPSLKNILSVFISLWTILFSYSDLYALINCLNIKIACFSVNLLLLLLLLLIFVRYYSKVPP